MVRLGVPRGAVDSRPGGELVGSKELARSVRLGVPRGAVDSRPGSELVGSKELARSVRLGVPRGAVDSRGILERERGVRVVAGGDTLLVAALMSEGMPMHEIKEGGGGGGR